MESFLGRYRNLTILVGVLFLQALGLAVQVKRSNDAENTRLIRIWVVDSVTPFERILVWAQKSSGNLWHNYVFLRGVRAENRELKRQIEEMRLEGVRLSEDAEQDHRLQKLLAFKQQLPSKTVAAQVIGSSGSDLSQSINIDKGSDEGLKPDMAVITATGIVGKVLHVYPSTAQVLMINDQTSGVGAMFEKTRLQGVLRGTPGGSIILERVMSDEKVSPGDTLLSSGGDQIFPKGMPVGTVEKVSPGHEMFLNIQVKPAADLSRLEEVLVVTEKPEVSAPAENAGRIRAADLLAQRLPSVPDKPPANTTKTGSAPANNAGSTTNSTPKPANANASAGTSTKPETKPATSEHTSAAITKPTGNVSPAVQLPKKNAQDSAPASTTINHANQPSPRAGVAKPAQPGTASSKPPVQRSPQTPATEDAPH
jgi:rod shape-determining protein MreC